MNSIQRCQKILRESIPQQFKCDTLSKAVKLCVDNGSYVDNCYRLIYTDTNRYGIEKETYSDHYYLNNGVDLNMAVFNPIMNSLVINERGDGTSTNKRKDVPIQYILDHIRYSKVKDLGDNI